MYGTARMMLFDLFEYYIVAFSLHSREEYAGHSFKWYKY